MLDKPGLVTRVEDGSCRRSRAHESLEPVNAAAFHIHAEKGSGGKSPPAGGKQRMGLLRRFDIAREQNDTRRLQLLQHGIEAGRNRRSIKAHDNELADLLAEGLVHEQMIVKQLGAIGETSRVKT